MSTYSLRCRNSACRHRRVASVHPDDYILVPSCKVCGQRKGWRIESRDYNQRNLCKCSGPESCKGQAFPHNTTHPLCDNNADGLRNQALKRGVAPADMPLEMMGQTMGKNDVCPF